MIPLFAAALEIQDYCRRQSFPHCIIGGLAVQRWGEPRLTQDVDLTILTGFGNEATFADALLAAFAARLPDAREFALRHRVLLLRSRGAVPIDIAFGAMPFEERLIARASTFEISPGVELLTCSAEDLVVLKAFAGRPRDWLDIEGVALRQGSRLDPRQIFAELLPLLELKQDEESAGRLRRLLGS